MGVSTDSAGLERNSISIGPTLSADGRYVAFQFSADNRATEEDNNLTWDIFLVVNPDYVPDTDGDGLRDDVEATAGTDINQIDTDGDGLSDYDELNWYVDPYTCTPGVDTKPFIPDTDGDGFTDGQEDWANSNPLDEFSIPATCDLRPDR